MTADSAEVGAVGRQCLSRGSRWKPAVWQLQYSDGSTRLRKEVASLPMRGRWLARWLLHRERRVLATLEGLAGIPRLLESSRDHWDCEFIQGQVLERQIFSSEPRRLADELFHILQAIHQRGVYHLDLRQKQNILVDEVGRLTLVDFGASFRCGTLSRLWLGPLLSWVDRQAVLKYLARYAPDALRPEEAKAVMKAQRLRRFWVFSKHRPRGEKEAAARRLRETGDSKEKENGGLP